MKQAGFGVMATTRTSAMSVSWSEASFSSVGTFIILIGGSGSPSVDTESASLWVVAMEMLSVARLLSSPSARPRAVGDIGGSSPACVAACSSCTEPSTELYKDQPQHHAAFQQNGHAHRTCNACGCYCGHSYKTHQSC